MTKLEKRNNDFGGQRQRIAIAKAYSKTNVIIFDNCISNNSIMKDRTRILLEPIAILRRM